MKKLLTVIMIVAASSMVISTANAAPSKDMPQRYQTSDQKPLNLTEEQAKSLVQASLIKHGKTDMAIIGKTETINLGNDLTYYIIYVGQSGQAKASKFVIVDAQNGRTHAYPKPKKMKKKGNKY